MDGWGIIEGDFIQLGGQTQRVRITNVDYSSNTITVHQSLSWTNAQGVSLAYEGSAPDLGAYEYGQTGNVISPSRLIPGVLDVSSSRLAAKN
jgi:hypothetical protein